MQGHETKIIRKRMFSSYLTAVISISLVLFIVGLIGLLLLNTKRLSDYVKENIGFTVYLKDDTKEADIYHLQKVLDTKHYVKETLYITAEQAAKEFQEEIGEDFVSFLGFNPLSPSIDVKLYAAYTNPDSIEVIETDLQGYQQIKEVYYQKSLVSLINDNVRKITIFMLGISAVLFLIAVALINNTIRLAVYSKRFLIRTMQLVGATGPFIRRPFIYQGIIQGIVGSVVAIALLSLVIYYLEGELEGIIGFSDIGIVAILFGCVVVSGIVIDVVSTYFAVNKYLRIKTDQLYS